MHFPFASNSSDDFQTPTPHKPKKKNKAGKGTDKAKRKAAGVEGGEPKRKKKVIASEEAVCCCVGTSC